MRCVVSCSSTSFPWFVFFFGALLWGSKIHKHTGSWMWQGSASVDRHTDSTSRDWFIKYLPLKSSFVNTRYKWGFWGDIFDESVPACAVCFSIHPSGYLSSCLCVQLCLDNISWTAQPYLTKLGMVVDYHEAGCHAERLVHCLPCQGHREGLYIQNRTIFTISSKLPVRLQPNSVW